jgi:hypothetical protein
MAAPRHGFGAHDRSALRLRALDEIREISLELRRLHVIGIAAKRQIAPAHVLGIGARSPKSAESCHMRVRDPRRLQHRWKVLPIELRVAARLWHRAHVDERVDTVCVQ